MMSDLARTRRVRRIGTAVGAVACAAAAVAVPGALLDPAGPDPAAAPTPSMPPRVEATEAPAPYPPVPLIEEWLSGLAQGAAPRAVLIKKEYLYDGPRRVRLPSADKPAEAWPLGRAPGGWFVATAATDASPATGHYTGRYGVLEESGRFKVFASGVLQGAAMSPDGTQVAMATIPRGGKPRASVADLRTGRVVSETSVGPTTRIEGWNPSGIWLASMPDTSLPLLRSARWVPGEPVREVGRAVPSSRSTDRMLRRTDDCEQVVTFDRTIAEYCGFGDGSGLLSPDGTVFVTPDQVARTIGSDRQVRLGFLRGLWFGDTAWEDPRHVLIVVDLSGKRTVVRCDVSTGACERAYSAREYLTLAER